MPANLFLEFRSESFRKTIDEESLESLGAGRSFIKRVTKNINVEGSLSYDFHPQDALYLLKHVLMGTVTSAQVGVTGSYKHTFTTGDMSTIAQKGLTFEVQPDAQTTTAFIHYGNRVNSFKLSGSVGEPIKAELSFIGRDSTTGTFATTTVVFTTLRPYMFQDLTFFYDGTTASITTGSAESIIGFELTVENNLHNDANARSLGSRLLTALPPGRRMVKLSITQRFDTTTAWSRFINNTQGAVRLTLDTGQTIGSVAAATTYSMLIDLGNVYYNSAIPEIADAGILTHKVDIDSISDTMTSAGKDIVVTVYSSTTAY